MPTEHLRRVSHETFGNAYMLEVGSAIANHPKDVFVQRQLVEATGLDKGLIASVIRRLENATLITRLPPDGRERPFLRSPSIFWEILDRFYDETSRTT